MLKFLVTLAIALALAAPAAAQDKLFPDSKLVVRDRFSVEVVGRGPDVVFIPGLASSRATWKATAERLKGRYRLHLIQIAGFAGEPARANSAGDVLIPTAEAIDAYLVDQKLSPAMAVGHSLGGTTLLYLAQKHPEHLKKVMVVDALPFFGAMMSPAPNPTVDSIRPTAVQMRDAMLRNTGPVTPQSLEPQMARMSKDAATRRLVAEWGSASDTSVVARAFYDDLMLDLRPGLGAMKTPIVLLFPDAVSVGMPAGMAEPLYRQLYGEAKTVRPKMIPDSAHFIMFDQPQAFAVELDAFLDAP
ncbi:alpha/beta hydrolase [Phenylobacterium sp.]|jgi:pimeloyl-ACP methyl ester carboxylesterase|uniref:alpha/beta fold hydrolase n=1 Tax=Phenylobacterium sp. TaxID=1871053 RepID=UPI002F9377B1